MLDSDGFAELVAQRPVLYHRAWDSDYATDESILEHGLERVASGYSGFWTSRPGHVFMTVTLPVHEKLPHMRPPGARPWTQFAIDVAQLERERFEPDEDCFLTHNFIDHELTRVGERECRRHRVPFPPSQWLAEWGAWLGCRCPTLAEWADAVDLGISPEATRTTIMANTTLSYRGVVPPSALRIVAHGEGLTRRPKRRQA
jgi:hypothetical protein